MAETQRKLFGELPSIDEFGVNSPWAPADPAAPVVGQAPPGLMSESSTSALPAMTSGGQQGLNPTLSDATQATMPSTDWGGIAGAGIGALGSAVGGIAQAAGQKALIDQAAATSSAGNALSTKLAKMQLAQGADQFGKNQALQALMWQLSANRAALNTGNKARDIRRQDEQLMSDVLSRIYMPRK